jgi:hypothetical protein
LTNFANFLGKISKCSISQIWGKKQEKRKEHWNGLKHLWIENVLDDGHCENLQEVSLTNGDYVT